MARSLHTAAHRELVSAAIALRRTAGLTQRQLAERLGREQNFVARVETGQRRVDLVEWVTLCRACGADPAAETLRLVTRVALLVPPGPTRRAAGRRRASRADQKR